MWSYKVPRRVIQSTTRNISSTAAVGANPTNHYDVLGITPKATQAEVKAAYYKLSKLHHPDLSVNEGENKDGDKFRNIAEAYEVLGNYKSRQMYDRGLYGHSRSTPRTKDLTPDHPNMAFYKSRFVKERVPTSQSSIYNFDEWVRNHYSESFTKTNIKYKPQRQPGKDDPREVQGDDPFIAVSVLVVIIILAGFSSLSVSNHGYDNPKPSRQIVDKPA